MRPDKRTGKRPRFNTNFSETDTAQIRAGLGFEEFIPWGEYIFLSKATRKERVEGYTSWLAGHLRLLLKNYKTPWLCLPQEERSRLCGIFDRSTETNIVHIGTVADELYHTKRSKLDRSLPFRFDCGDRTSILLSINWRSSKKRILSAIGNLLDECRPAGVKQWDGRGKKARDFRVMLERIALMRLLHHYSLSEIKRLLPEAWALYANRKWYDERRQALKDFRSVIGYTKPDQNFPKSWETKAHRAEASGRATR